MTKRAFGELELAILNILKGEKRITVKDVHQLLGGNDKYNTIMTVMNRLTEKKILARERTGLQYEYWALPAQTKISTFVEQFKQKILGIKTATMVSYLIDSADDITDDDLREMERLIEKTKSERQKK